MVVLLLLGILTLSSCTNRSKPLPKLFHMTRLTADGQTDASFGNLGRVEFTQPNPLTYIQYNASEDIFARKDGKLLVICDGCGTNNGSRIDSLLRFDANGILEKPLSTSMLQHITFFIHLVAIRDNGSMLFIKHQQRGHVNEDEDTRGYTIAVSQSDPEGISDKTFVNKGEGMGTGLTYGTVALMPDGKILAAGIKESSRKGALTIERYDENGVADMIFGTRTSLPETSYVTQIAVQENRKIVIVGEPDAKFRNDMDVLLYRFNEDGTNDTSFGNNGVVHTGLQDGASTKTVVLLPNEEMFVGGWKGSNYILMRYQRDGSPAKDFGTNGQIVVGESGMGNAHQETILQSDGKIVTAYTKRCGWIIGFGCSKDLDDEFVIKRYQPDGTPDTTFGNQGIVKMTGFGQHIFHQADNKIVVTGRFVQ